MGIINSEIRALPEVEQAPAAASSASVGVEESVRAAFDGQRREQDARRRALFEERAVVAESARPAASAEDQSWHRLSPIDEMNARAAVPAHVVPAAPQRREGSSSAFFNTVTAFFATMNPFHFHDAAPSDSPSTTTAAEVLRAARSSRH